MTRQRDADVLGEHGIDLPGLFRQLIDDSGMSRYQIAQAIGVSESTLARPYNGERLPTLELVCRVAGVVGYEIAVTAKKRRRRRENA